VNVVLDCEASNLLPMATRLHVLCLRDIDNPDRTWSFVETERDAFLYWLEVNEVELMVFHNGVGYDLPLLRKVWGIPYSVHPSGDTFNGKSITFVDTFQLSQFVNPDRPGGHGLGNLALLAGTEKIDYKGGFEEYTPEQHEYCIQDTFCSVKVYWFLLDEVRRKYGEIS